MVLLAVFPKPNYYWNCYCVGGLCCYLLLGIVGGASFAAPSFSRRDILVGSSSTTTGAVLWSLATKNHKNRGDQREVQDKNNVRKNPPNNDNNSNINNNDNNKPPFGFTPNQDERQVPPYDLPPLLTMENGMPVRTAQEWTGRRRPELLQLFRTHMYGTCPDHNYSCSTTCHAEYTLLSNNKHALNGGIATRRQIRIKLTSSPSLPSDSSAVDSQNEQRQEQQKPPSFSKEWIVLLYIPNRRRTETRIPCFLGLNFAGNQAIHPDPGILETSLVPGEEHFATSRGGRAGKWQVERIVQRGYALATVYSGSIEPDDATTAFTNGVHQLFPSNRYIDSNPASWGTIAAWAWGLSRTLDLLQDDQWVPEIDASRVAVLGHSRKGKAALWAAAEDARFAMAISNNSGCGGAALSRRRFGETLDMMNAQFPTWLCANNNNNDRQDQLPPIDQHQLLALIAPRPVYVASAVQDLWADPHGEFLSIQHAEPVYHLLGLPGLDHSLTVSDKNLKEDEKENEQQQQQPGMLFGEEGLVLDAPYHGPQANMGYHCRSGGHDVLAYDWDRYLDFADQNFLNPIESQHKNEQN